MSLEKSISNDHSNCQLQGESHSTRRSFLGILSGLIGAAISATLGINIGRYAVAPALAKSNEGEWIDLGALAKIPADKLIKRTLTVAQEAGWGKFTASRSVWIRRNEESLTIFSATCPHLGCTVNAKEETFVCACHNSQWNATGEKTSGPTPRHLDVLEHRIENEVLQVKYQDFKQGIETKELL